MPPKKRSRTVPAPPAPSTPDRKTPNGAHGEDAGAAAQATPKHAHTEGRKGKTPRQEAASPLPRGNSASPKSEKKQMKQASLAPSTDRHSQKKSKERSKSLSVEGRSICLSLSESSPAAAQDKPSAKQTSPIRPVKLDIAEDAVTLDSTAQLPSMPLTNFVPTNTVKDLESLVLRSKVIAPDISGLSCVAANRAESEVVVARENGSLVLYSVEYFQNIPHFTQLRATGGRVRRTMTRLAFLDLASVLSDASSGAMSSSSSSLAAQAHEMRDRFFVASYLSGQIVIYDSQTLFPVSVYQRTGGAVWDMTIVHGSTIYAALADGSWHRLRVVLTRSTGGAAGQTLRPTIELERIIPRIAGADRAFSVTASASLGLVVGTDDGGNVHAWRHASSAAQSGAASDRVSRDAATAGGSLAAHETLWTCRLPKGMAMCCAIADGIGASARPVVAVGTSMGDVVMVDAQHGHILHTFTTHKGPVSTITCDQNVFYASGWHESLRAFRFAAATAATTTAPSPSSTPAAAGGVVVEGEWYPAEVKRRTHYHEASQLLVLPQRQLMLSAARDGTLMFSPIPQLFTAPAVYVNVTTQRFTFAQEKNVLLQTRLDRIEAFRMDAAMRHWSPLFAHNIHGKYHLNGLWCDPALHYIVFSTDERVVLSRVGWRDGAEAALAISRMEEVLELPARRGLLDAVFVPRSSSAEAAADVQSGSDADAAAPAPLDEGALYLLFDDCVLYVSLADGFPVIRTELTNRGERSGDAAQDGGSVRAVKLVHAAASPRNSSKASKDSHSLVAYGLNGLWRCELTADGTPNLATAQVVAGPAATYTHVASVPPLHVTCSAGASQGTTSAGAAPMIVGLSAADGRYVKNITGLATASKEKGATALFPQSLPHDVTFVAELPRAQRAAQGVAAGTKEDAPTEESKNYIGFFGKGLVFVGRREWRMATRMTVEAAFVMRDGCHILVLERNLEKTLEALPLCWKVRRFGN